VTFNKNFARFFILILFVYFLLIIICFTTKVQRRSITEHVKANTESHLKLACEKLQEFQALSTLNAADVKELQTQMASGNKRIKELSEAVLKSEELQEFRDKIAVTNETLQELQRRGDGKTTDRLSALQTEDNALIKEIKELKKDLANDRKKLLELQQTVSYGLKDLRGEATGIKKRQQKLETANAKLNTNLNDLNEVISELGGQIVKNEIETDHKITNFYRQICVILNSYHQTLQNFKCGIFFSVIVAIFILYYYFTSFPNAFSRGLEFVKSWKIGG